MRQQFEIPEQQKSVLKTMLTIKEDEPLPEDVNEAYWITKNVADRISKPLTDSDLLAVVLYCGAAKKAPKPPDRDALTMFRDGEIRIGDNVFCKWRGKEGVQAKLLSVAADDRFIVRFVGKPEEYHVPNKDVSKIQNAEVSQ